MGDENRSPGEPFDFEPLLSDFSAHGDIREMVAHFLQDLGRKAVMLREALDNGNAQGLLAIACQIKGAAGGYGFPLIAASAGALHAELLGTEAEVSTVSERVEALVELCRRATS